MLNRIAAIRILEETLDHIDSLPPERFDMETFGEVHHSARPEDERYRPPSPCGTAMCLAGHALYHPESPFSPKWVLDSFDYWKLTAGDQARPPSEVWHSVFTYDEIDNLFFRTRSTTNDLRKTLASMK